MTWRPTQLIPVWRVPTIKKWRKNINATTNDFIWDEETGKTKVSDNEKVIVGGMITDKTIKYTKNNKTMAFLTLEDLLGTVEVIVFPRDYERYHTYLNVDEKIFVSGHAIVEEDKNGKIICEKIYGIVDAVCHQRRVSADGTKTIPDASFF